MSEEQKTDINNAPARPSKTAPRKPAARKPTAARQAVAGRNGVTTKVSGPSYPGQNPIAVIDRNGHVLPFTDNHVDRFYLMKSDVTYVYDIDELKAIVKNNNAALEQQAVENIRHGTFLPPASPNPGGLNAGQVSEHLATAFNPEMIE